MRLNLAFASDGRIDGEGIDDIAPFVINGQFDCATSRARWTKQYIALHRVEYSGIYCARTICGDWTLGRGTGGFWIWPASLSESDVVEEQREIELPLELIRA